ncbi:MAG: serine/threonine protein kinase bacterial, partial [bacterium]
MTGKQILNYKIGRKLGEGGQGQVYEAEDIRLRRKVALKILPAELVADEKSRKRFLREAQLASALDHPNICTIYEINEFEGLHFIVMQYLEGKRLKQMVRGTPLELDFALSIAMQMADALGVAHQRGVIHRDVKATNIMVNDRGQAKILDFGLAKGTTDIGDRAVQDLTQQGVPFGTAGYMSPEQARGSNIDYRTDVFSLGVVIYEMVTGRLPFPGKSSVEIMHAVLHNDPIPVIQIVNSLPVRLEQIIEKAMTKDVNQRYQNMADLYNDIKTLTRELQLRPGKYYEATPLVAPRPRKSSWLREGMMGWLYKRFRPRESTSPSQSPTPTPSGMGGSNTPGSNTPATSSNRSTVDEIPAMLDSSLPSQIRTNERAEKRRTIAIMPFKNLSGDIETDFYSFSLADSVITELASL